MKTITAFAISLLFAGAAYASDEGTSVDFRLNESELATDDGAAAVYARMEMRAERKCDPLKEYRVTAREACAAELVAQWVDAVGDERLAAVHEASK